MSVNMKAWIGIIILALIMALLLFLPAGTIHYWQAWVFLAVFFTLSSLITLYLMKNDPELLKRRLKGGFIYEKRKTQKVIMIFTSLGFVALLIVPALDHRFGWSKVSLYVVILGNILVMLGYFIIFRVYKKNPFTSATIEVAAEQKVITTGPYAIVRHPMYAGSLLYMIGIPLSLGSYWGLLAFAAMTPFLFWRLFDEERFLSQNLPGYTEYCVKVPWRLIPHIL
jgi:protein-S-isoprenylcysteine O-methyltransferase Ste14